MWGDAFAFGTSPRLIVLRCTPRDRGVRLDQGRQLQTSQKTCTVHGDSARDRGVHEGIAHDSSAGAYRKRGHSIVLQCRAVKIEGEMTEGRGLAKSCELLRTVGANLREGKA